MRNKAVAILFLVLVCVPVPEAAAYFEGNSLVLVVYNEDDNEIGIDLGDMAQDWSEADRELAPAGTVSLDKFEDINDWSYLNAGCFAYQDGYQNWFGTSLPDVPAISAASIQSFIAGATGVTTFYRNQQSDSQFSVAKASDVNSYDTVMNSNSTAPGYYAGFNASLGDDNGEVNLAALANPAGSVQLYLYHYDVITPPGQYTAVISINADGSVVLNPADNHPPTDVAATASSTTVAGGGSVDLSGSAEDADGDALSYTWTHDYDAGFEQAGQQFTYTAPTVQQETEIVFTLTVSDGELEATDTVAITVTPSGGENSPPTDVTATASSTTVSGGGSVDLSGSAEDADGDALSYTWTNDYDGGFEQTGQQFTYTAPTVQQETEIVFTLTVSDGELEATDTVTVTVTPSGGENSPPTDVAATASSTTVPGGGSVEFSGSAEDADGDALSYTWTHDYDAGFEQTGQQFTYTAPTVQQETDIVFTLTVSDGLLDATGSVTVTVVPRTPSVLPAIQLLLLDD